MDNEIIRDENLRKYWLCVDLWSMRFQLSESWEYVRVPPSFAEHYLNLMKKYAENYSLKENRRTV